MVAPPDAMLLDALGDLRGEPSAIGSALAILSAAARQARIESVGREFHDLFVGIGRGEVLPYGSYYLTGFLHERPLAKLRDDLRRLGIERAAGVPEPEDHLGFLLEAYAGLLAGTFDAPLEAGAAFWRAHVEPWAGRCFADIERADAARFYRAVGALGRTMIEIESAALALPE